MSRVYNKRKYGVKDVSEAVYENHYEKYIDNPLIQALNAMPTAKDIMNFVSVSADDILPFLDHKNVNMMKYAMADFDKLTTCYPFYLDLSNAMYQGLLKSYSNKNIIGPKNFNNCKRKKIIPMYKALSDIVINEVKPNVISVIGWSGTGKTTAVRNLLKWNPQVIIHSKYNNITLNRIQLTWVYVEAPSDGSIISLIQNLLREIDRLLNFIPNCDKRFVEDILNISKTRILTSSDVKNELVKIIDIFSIGAIVMDEVQNLSSLGIGGAPTKYITELMNSVDVCFIMIGTNDAESLINSNLRLTRRFSENMYFSIEPLEKETTWPMLINTLFSMEMINIDVEEKETVGLNCIEILNGNYIKSKRWCKLSDALFNISQGITAIAVSVYKVAILQSIDHNKAISDDDITYVYNNFFKSLHSTMKLIKKRDERALKKAGITDVSFICNSEVGNYIDSIMVDSLITEMQEDKQQQKRKLKYQLCMYIEEKYLDVIPSNRIIEIAEQVMDEVKANEYIMDTLINNAENIIAYEIAAIGSQVV